MRHGEIWWADLPTPSGSEPGYRRPVLIIQSDAFNESRINTIICAIITSNLSLQAAPGNVFLSKFQSKLPKESVINISQIVTLDKNYLTEFISSPGSKIMAKVEAGLKLIFTFN